MRKEELDTLLDKGKKPVFCHVKCTDVPDFLGKLRETYMIYQETALWPQVVLGEYRGVVVILNVKAI